MAIGFLVFQRGFVEEQPLEEGCEYRERMLLQNNIIQYIL